jgi:hypothetical protein
MLERRGTKANAFDIKDDLRPTMGHESDKRPPPLFIFFLKRLNKFRRTKYGMRLIGTEHTSPHLVTSLFLLPLFAVFVHRIPLPFICDVCPARQGETSQI